MKEEKEKNTDPIMVEVFVKSPLEKVWKFFTEPQHVTRWYFASDDWEAPRAENDLRTGGSFMTRMSAKDKSAGFDFGGTYTDVRDFELIEYEINGDARHVKIEFMELPEGIRVRETFDPEKINSKELQRGGWQAILNNFKHYTEGSNRD